MPVHLVVAYVIFCAVPLGLAISLALRRRGVEKKLDECTADKRLA